ncbi:hypothetical protein [Mesorhizobium sp.]|nr:hypothetical protein [Mesorhizobium sp.]
MAPIDVPPRALESSAAKTPRISPMVTVTQPPVARSYLSTDNQQMELT